MACEREYGLNDAPASRGTLLPAGAGIAGSICGLAGVAGDGLLNAGATRAALVAGFLFALLGLYGAVRALSNRDRSALVMIAATIGLVLALGWWASAAAVLLLIASGLALRS